MAIYITVQGDTFDTIARATYGNETKIQALMEARENIRLIDTEVFPAGVEVFVPEVSEEASFVETDDLPEWRR
jgi:phage tail protein X